LIRQAVASDIPVLGHCLGGQLIAKAMGGSVGPNPVKEIGWGEVGVLDTPQARDWFGDIKSFQAFHWHGETFSLPAGATRILTNAHCVNQAYVLGEGMGKHLGMQCHVEMTSTMIESWCHHWAAEGVPASASVQTPEQMQADMNARIAAMRVVADRLYTRWTLDLKN
jgi:GMP synthase-like glutamine amidotransferase